jgi:hypothetical protein
MRVMVFATMLFFAVASVVFAAEPNGMTGVRLMMYRLDIGVLGIVPLQSQMKTDFAFSGSAGPWPKLARYMESGEPADLPAPLLQSAGMSEIERLPFFTKEGPGVGYVLPKGGALDQAILGVGYSSLIEIGEHPIFMTIPDVQYYLNDVFSRLARDGPPELDRDVLAKMRALMMGANSKDVTHELEQKIEGLSVQLLARQPAKPFFVGQVAEQCAYNAFVLHEEPFDTLARNYLSSGQTTDLTTPDGGSWRKELGVLKTGDWPAIYKSCRVFVQTLLLTPKAFIPVG